MPTTHDRQLVLARLSLTGRDEKAINAMVDGWTPRQREAMVRDGLFGAAWRITHTLNHPTAKLRARAEFHLAAILALEEP